MRLTDAEPQFLAVPSRLLLDGIVHSGISFMLMTILDSWLPTRLLSDTWQSQVSRPEGSISLL